MYVDDFGYWQTLSQDKIEKSLNLLIKTWFVT